jgi:hypothetical protein
MRGFIPLQKLIRFHLLEQRNRFHEMIDMDALAALVRAAFEGHRAEIAGVRMYAKAKGLLRSIASPTLYNIVRSKAQGRFVVATIPADMMLLRLMKLWCDRLP